MTVVLTGTGVSRGVVIGKVHVLDRGQPEVAEVSLPSDRVDAEIRRFRAALRAATRELKAIRGRVPASTSPDIRAFIDTHLLMLEDSALATAPQELIRTRRCNAEWALKLQRDSLVDVFEEMDDPYLRTRKDDVVHVVDRLLRILLKQDNHPHDSETPLRGHIVVADDLTPADTVLLQHQGVAGLVTEYGGTLSHTAIMARSLGLPAAVGVHRARLYLRSRERLVLDGSQGVVVAGADSRILEHYRQRQRAERAYFTELRKLKTKPAVTRDGEAVTLLANIELPEDVRALHHVSPAGIGLYRTEFLFMNRIDAPDEEEQLENYVGVLEALGGRPVTIRTLDLGADKTRGTAGASPVATNPALGLRAIRLCLHEQGLFRPQLRAILRASAYGPVRVMIPMLSNVHEVRQVLHLLEELRCELDAQGKRYDSQMPVGGMIEVPAAAITAHLFASYLDFLSIGTNDLIQYTLAIDRIDNEVSYLYDPLHPAVLRLIHAVLRAGRQARVPVAMCGEMAGDWRYTRLLLGLGLREFSTHPSTLLEVKRVVKSSRITELTRPARQALRCSSADEAHRLVGMINRNL
ncbi:MAG: phosphoenolpyruvate--protein phosphotransferase [Gammaproteobacteria bacterium]|nr:phosphoenolpyruvate--protein phosphotransferase [Gammaproteobacteria bacterium]NIR98802.1 phosphoenolpyruvate--protein phosphotransferase [Gammaproteobacteria bacterium]NIT64512.1 phosphoenolpyruvate--protein phosphotransferase [Gammaproteobacteria bacterium]NIV21432.1 phosphoenolpyruvate--protein phosphotransferase [Gammaproteobacteria bacterium]NIX11302.1 phosphoenolpyruvate--protein phosphotransferase [Gammaproteobacteria bacterium]